MHNKDDISSLRSDNTSDSTNGDPSQCVVVYPLDVNEDIRYSINDADAREITSNATIRSSIKHTSRLMGVPKTLANNTSSNVRSIDGVSKCRVDNITKVGLQLGCYPHVFNSSIDVRKINQVHLHCSLMLYHSFTNSLMLNILVFTRECSHWFKACLALFFR